MLSGFTLPKNLGASLLIYTRLDREYLPPVQPILQPIHRGCPPNTRPSTVRRLTLRLVLVRSPQCTRRGVELERAVCVVAQPVRWPERRRAVSLECCLLAAR